MINYENYKIFKKTEKDLRKKYSKEVLEVYGKILAYLYQNGYSIDADTDEDVEISLSMFNYFKNESDFEDLKNSLIIDSFEIKNGKYVKTTKKPSNSSFKIGKEILEEELESFLSKSTFCRQENSSPVVIKTLAEIHFSKIEELTEELNEIFNSTDSEIVGALSKFRIAETIKNKIEEIKKYISKGIKILTWNKFKELSGIVYGLYIKLKKVKTDVHKLSILSNINAELYSGIGGWNPNNGEIKTLPGSAVNDLKKYYELPSNSKIFRTLANSILKDSEGEESEEIKFLESWNRCVNMDNDRAKQIIIHCLLNGCLALVSLKNNLTLLEDRKNSDRAEIIKREFSDIIRYAGISVDYLY